SLQGSESSRRCSFMHVLMRPPPGLTSLQKALISGLHAPKIARAAPPCAIALVTENNKIAPAIMIFGIDIVPTRFPFPPCAACAAWLLSILSRLVRLRQLFLVRIR